MEINFILNSVPITWFVMGLLILLLEIAVPGFILFFFGIGAWVVALLTLFLDINSNFQLLIFMISSLLSLYYLRTTFNEYFFGKVVSNKSYDDELDSVIGERVKVITLISPKFKGKVELHGTNWNATSEEEINEGEVVEIIAKDNLTLKVKKI